MTGFIHDWPGFYRHSPTYTAVHTYEISDLQLCLKESQYRQIVSNTHLFWLAFCKTAAGIQPGSTHEFSVKIEKKLDHDYVEIIGIEGREFAVDEIQKTVEKIREFFQDSLDSNRPVTIVPVAIVSSYYLRRRAPVVDLRDWIQSDTDSVLKFRFDESIKPVLPQLASVLGMSLSINSCQQKIRTSDWYQDNLENRDCEGITISPLLTT